MIARLVWSSIRQRPGRSLLLLIGYALGVGVTIALLSIGEALLDQARDRDLLGGGDLVVLPAGIDLETLRTGGVSSMFFTIEQASFLYREVLASPRFADRVLAAAPWMEDELMYVDVEGALVPVSAYATIPSLAHALGVGPAEVEGAWEDVPDDDGWAAPRDSALYAELDALHLPRGEAAGDSTWAEWHYFNVLLPDTDGWLYLTYMIAGAVPDGRWGGRLLATVVEPGVGERVYSTEVAAEAVEFREGRPDLAIAGSRVRIERNGTYRLTASIPAETGSDTLRIDLVAEPASRRYLPPLDIGGGAFASGYTAPILDGRADGTICEGARRCFRLEGARTYHDHNWGVWRDVAWDWGQATAGRYSILYGGVRSGAVAGSRFLYLADADGFAGVYTIRDLRIVRDEPAPGAKERGDPGPADAGPPSLGSRAEEPRAISLIAVTGADSLRLDVEVGHTRVTDVPADRAGSERRFYQMRGRATLSGRLGAAAILADGDGFFETWDLPGPSAAGDASPRGPDG